jgi:hypothetical protein
MKAKDAEYIKTEIDWKAWSGKPMNVFPSELSLVLFAPLFSLSLSLSLSLPYFSISLPHLFVFSRDERRANKMQESATGMDTVPPLALVLHTGSAAEGRTSRKILSPTSVPTPPPPPSPFVFYSGT